MNITKKIGIALQVIAVSSVAGCFATLEYSFGGDLLLVDSKILEIIEKRHGKIRSVNSIQNAQSGYVPWFKGQSPASEQQFKNLLDGARYCLAETGVGEKYFRCYFTKNGHRMVKSVLHPVDEMDYGPLDGGTMSEDKWLNDGDLIAAAEKLSKVESARQINGLFFWVSLVSPFIFLSGLLLRRAGRKGVSQEDRNN